MNPKERRFTPRHKLQIPLTVRPLAASNLPAQSLQSTDVSIRGIYFASDLSFEIGMPAEVLLQMPEDYRPGLAEVELHGPGGAHRSRRRMQRQARHWRGNSLLRRAVLVIFHGFLQRSHAAYKTGTQRETKP